MREYFATPQGAAALNGLLRALVLALVGLVGAKIAPAQVELIINLTSVMVTVALGFTGITVAQVAARTEPAIKTTETTVVATPREDA